MIYKSNNVYPSHQEADGMQVSKWGNSLAIRLPSVVVEALDLKEGDDIEVHVLDRRTFAIDRKLTVGEQLKMLRKFRGRLPADFRFDRNDASER